MCLGKARNAFVQMSIMDEVQVLLLSTLLWLHKAWWAQQSAAEKASRVA
jgi:hypothetical protein